MVPGGVCFLAGIPGRHQLGLPSTHIKTARFSFHPARDGIDKEYGIIVKFQRFNDLKISMLVIQLLEDVFQPAVCPAFINPHHVDLLT